MKTLVQAAKQSLATGKPVYVAYGMIKARKPRSGFRQIVTASKDGVTVQTAIGGQFSAKLADGKWVACNGRFNEIAEALAEELNK